MRQRFAPSGVLSKLLTALTVASGLLWLGCSGEAERSESSKSNFKRLVEDESNTEKVGKGGKVVSGPKSIKGKLVDIEKNKGQ